MVYSDGQTVSDNIVQGVNLSGQHKAYTVHRYTGVAQTDLKQLCSVAELQPGFYLELYCNYST